MNYGHRNISATKELVKSEASLDEYEAERELNTPFE